MQMERESRINGRSGVGQGGDYHHHHHHQVDPNPMESKLLPVSSSSSSTLLPSSSSSGSPGGCIGIVGVNYIEHTVSKFDTLAGVAIKYGVEVADIKRINGLVTDLQMFALKTLHIPLPGRHPPSPSLSNGFDAQGPSSTERTPPRRRHSDLLESLQSLNLNSSSPMHKVSPAMSNLQGYYGLKSKDQNNGSEGVEMSIFQKGGAHYSEDGPFAKPSPLSNQPLSHHRKSKSVANGFQSENGELAEDVSTSEIKDGGSSKWSEKLFRRRQKSEADFSRTPELLMKEDNNNSGGWFSAITGKGLALRAKAASRTTSGADAEPGWVNPVPIGLGDSIVAESFNGVRKSSSTPSLQDQESSSSSSISSSIWTTSKWSLKPDLQALSSSAIARPIFDGLPKPITGRRNKTALD